MVYRSKCFRTEYMARKAYDEVRARIKAVYHAKTGRDTNIRIPSEAIRLVQETSGITQCTGLEDGMYHLKHSKRTFRWDICVDI